MEKALAAAAELGKQIAQDEAFQRLRAAEAAVQSDAASQKILQEFDRQRRKIEALEGARKPVEPEDKHEMIRLSDAVHSAPKLQELVRAQADYMELMNRVNKAIQQALSPGQTDSGAGAEVACSRTRTRTIGSLARRHRLAQSIPRCMISSASGISKSLKVCPSAL